MVIVGSFFKLARYPSTASFEATVAFDSLSVVYSLLNELRIDSGKYMNRDLESNGVFLLRCFKHYFEFVGYRAIPLAFLPDDG